VSIELFPSKSLLYCRLFTQLLPGHGSTCRSIQNYWFPLSGVLEQRFSNFSEVGTTFISQNSSADHLTLVPSKANLSF
jgi:hypothetical protein